MLTEESKKIRKKVETLGIESLDERELRTFASMFAHLFKKTVQQTDVDNIVREVEIAVYPKGTDALIEALKKAGVVPARR